MNIQCPSCQKLLQVPEQYAGQLMKCPLCNGTFTLPGLPAEPTPPAAPTVAPPVPLPPSSSPPPDPAAAQAPVDPFADLGAPAPARDTEPAMSAAPASPFAGLGAPAKPPSSHAAAAPAAPPPAGYTRAYTVWFSPQVLQYVAPVAVVLIFLLQFVSWVGISVGGVSVATQGAWGAAFGSISVDNDTSFPLHDVPVTSAKDLTDKLGGSGFVIIYLLLFVFLALPLTIACLVYEVKPFPLPPPVQPFLRFRWGIVALANTVVFFFLVLQLLLGFGLESLVQERIDKEVATMNAKTTAELKKAEMVRGAALNAVGRSTALRLVVVLHLLAITAAALVYCLEQRGNRPLPKIELLW